MRGTCKWFSDKKGYGFITPDGKGSKDVFVHHSEIRSDDERKTLEEGDKVEFDTKQAEKGVCAIEVKKVG